MSSATLVTLALRTATKASRILGSGISTSGGRLFGLDPVLPAPSHRLAFLDLDAVNDFKGGPRRGDETLNAIVTIVRTSHSGVPGAQDYAIDARLLDGPTAHGTGLHC